MTDSKPLRLALVGCGEVCEHKHLPALGRVSGLCVTALIDTDSQRRARVASRFHIAHQLPSIDGVLRDDLADIVGVLVPPGAHAGIAEQVLAAGRHVLIEKPLALSLDDADALAAAAARSSAIAQTGFHMRWHRLIRRARQALRDGAIGRPESIRTTWSSPRADTNIPAWKTRRASGGGALVELGVHVFDLWRFLLDTDVSTVYALSRDGTRQDESAVVTATLANGVLANAMLSERSAHEIEIEIAGDRGRLRVSCLRFDGFEIHERHETRGMVGPRMRGLKEFSRELPGGVMAMRRLGDYGDSYRGQWQGLLDAIRSRTAPECTVEDGRAAVRVMLAASASTMAGGPIRVADAPRRIAEEAVRA